MRWSEGFVGISQVVTALWVCECLPSPDRSRAPVPTPHLAKRTTWRCCFCFLEALYLLTGAFPLLLCLELKCQRPTTTQTVGQEEAQKYRMLQTQCSPFKSCHGRRNSRMFQPPSALPWSPDCERKTPTWCLCHLMRPKCVFQGVNVVVEDLIWSWSPGRLSWDLWFTDMSPSTRECVLWPLAEEERPKPKMKLLACPPWLHSTAAKSWKLPWVSAQTDSSPDPRRQLRWMSLDSGHGRLQAQLAEALRYHKCEVVHRGCFCTETEC